MSSDVIDGGRYITAAANREINLGSHIGLKMTQRHSKAD